jgi:hypothetical protein
LFGSLITSLCTAIMSLQCRAWLDGYQVHYDFIFCLESNLTSGTAVPLRCLRYGLTGGAHSGLSN